MRILFVASEGLPFSKTGGLADVVEALPKALVQQGHEVAVVLPRYRGTQAKAVVIPSLTVPFGKTLRFPAIADGGMPHGVRYFFVDDPEYFDREHLYGTAAGDYPDNAERFAEFARSSWPSRYGCPRFFIVTTGRARWCPFCCARFTPMIPLCGRFR